MIELAPGHKRGLSLANPILNASGTLGFADEARGLLALEALGAFVTNALTPHSRQAAHPPNALRLGPDWLAHTGLPNPGLRLAIRHQARAWERLGAPVIVHLAATHPAEVRRGVEWLENVEGVAAVELGLRDDIEPAQAVEQVRAAGGGLPLLVRLPLARAEDLCRPVWRAGADALTVGAPLRASARAETRTVTGRLYGPAAFDVALYAVRAVAALCPAAPLIGAGGIFSAQHVRALLAAGARAVQVDAWLWNDPRAVEALARQWAD